MGSPLLTLWNRKHDERANPPAAAIVTFDSGGALVYTDDLDIPGFETIMKARFTGIGAKIEQTSGGKGKITTAAGSDSAWFVGKINQFSKPTWKAIWKFNATVISGQIDTFFNDVQLTAHVASEPATYITGFVVFSDGRVGFRHNSGTLDYIDPILASGTYTLGTEVIVSLEKTATEWKWDFDGNASIATVLTSSTVAHTGEYGVWGENYSGLSATIEFDDIEGVE